MSILRSTAAALLVASLVLPVTAFASADGADASLTDAFRQGKVSLNVRTRYEGVEQSALQDADAVTIRTRLGFTTAPVHGFSAMVEAENITAVDGDWYSQAGINPGGAGRAVVADPEGSELNQAFLSYASGPTTLVAGRQRLVHDQARFLGDVGWRQIMQTFDALAVTNRGVDAFALNYAYLYQVNRVFGDRSPQGDWESDSHALHATYTGIPSTVLTGYAYLLDFDNSAVNSCATYGMSLSGTPALGAKLSLSYRIEYARQNDYGSSPLRYSADYRLAELGMKGKPGLVAAGYEVLGSDNNAGFRTPLATLHAFNGWADVFLTTPAVGLRDTYLKAAVNLPGAFGLLAFYHAFETDSGDTLGHEWDAHVTRKFGRHLTALIKVATFRRDVSSLPNVTKLWLQVEFNF